MVERTAFQLKLGKGSAFVKSRLRRLPQFEETWEADVQPIPGKRPGQINFWLGMVIEQEDGGVLTTLSLDSPPTVNEFAKLLANAMYRPMNDDQQHRPTKIMLRREPEWDEVFPHLRELGIELEAAEALPIWAEAAEEFGIGWEQTLRSLSGNSSSSASPVLGSLFPTVSKWVQRGGWIEIGEQDEFGFVVRALHEGGLAFESTKASSLDEAMIALELGIAAWLMENDVDLG